MRAIAPALSDITPLPRPPVASAAVRRAHCGSTARSPAGIRFSFPLIIEFIRRYPDVKVDIVTEGRLVDIVQAGFDAGVRVASAVPPNMTIVPLGQRLRYRVVGSPDYFKTHPRPVHPHELGGHDCIRIRWPSGAPYEWEFEKDGEVIQVDAPWSLSLRQSWLDCPRGLGGRGPLPMSPKPKLPTMSPPGGLFRC